MPRKLSTEEIIIVSAGVCAVAAPPAVTGLVSLLGFGAGGIALGSPGAWLMSLYGGFVPAGSLVATLQSVGAAGLGTSGILTSMAASAVIGGSTASVAIATSDPSEWHKKIEPLTSKFAQDASGWYKGTIEPLAFKLVQNAGERYKKEIEPSASKFAQNAGEFAQNVGQNVGEWYMKEIEPSASKLAQNVGQNTGEWYMKEIEPSASKLAQNAGKFAQNVGQNAGKWYKKEIEPSASKLAQDAGEWSKKNIETSASVFARAIGGWFS